MAERDNYTTVSDGDELSDGYFNDIGYTGALGEVRQFALSVSGAVTKATLQSKGWAICDGTTPATQGISSADITASTPNLENKFVRASDDEASGATGGADTHTITEAELPAHVHTVNYSNSDGGSGDSMRRGASVDGTINSGSTGSGDAHNNIPAYYELVFFIKVKTTMS